MKHKLIYLLFYLPITLFSQPWQTDLTFGADGIVTTNIDTAGNRILGIVPMLNGDIIAVGNALSGDNYDICLAKYLNNGSLDLSFGDGGILIDNSTPKKNYVTSTFKQADGKFIVCGYETYGYNWDAFLTRYLANGENDTSFGSSGYVSIDLGNYLDEFTELVVQPDGKIVAVGYTLVEDIRVGVIARFYSDGSLDESFGDMGLVHLSTAVGGDLLMNIKLQTDGKIVITGFSINATNDSDFICTRLLSNGELDTTFSGDGTFTYDYGDNEYAENIIIQADGKIVLGGFTLKEIQNHTLIIRLLENGFIDNSFGNDGVYYLANSRCKEMIMKESSIIIAGTNFITSSNSDFMLYALTMEGKLDTNFCEGNFIYTDVGSTMESPTCMIFANENSILMGGGSGYPSQFVLLKFKNATTPVAEILEDENDVIILPNPVSPTCNLITSGIFEQCLILDINGRAVANVKLIKNDKGYNISIPSELANGNYFLVLKNKTQYTTIPFVK